MQHALHACKKSRNIKLASNFQMVQQQQCFCGFHLLQWVRSFGQPSEVLYAIVCR